jgi:mRNA-degrading endonuclease RelE of RelBE toxin-antitoxin system
MDNGDTIRVETGAWIGWVLLDAPVREQIRQQLTELANQPPERWPAALVTRLDPDPDLYMLRVGDLRVFFRRGEAGDIAILDMVKKETLDRYFSAPPEAATK